MGARSRMPPAKEGAERPDCSQYCCDEGKEEISWGNGVGVQEVMRQQGREPEEGWKSEELGDAEEREDDSV